MNEPLPTIDDILKPFFERHLEGTAGVKRQRILQVKSLLHEYLEARPDTFFTPSELKILVAEREFDPRGAVCRVMNAETLLYGLLGFIQPPHLQPDPLLQRAQLRLVESLIARLVYTGLAEDDTACFQWELRRALDKAKDDLNRHRREKAQAGKAERQRAAERAHEP